MKVFPGEMQKRLPSVLAVLGAEWKHDMLVGGDLRNRQWEYGD